jgi:hypothetical protein
MTLDRGLLALTAAPLIIFAELAISQDLATASPARALAQEKADLQKSAPPAGVTADRLTMIQGKTTGEWLAALKDRDAAVRERAVEILGERALDPAIPGDERSRL